MTVQIARLSSIRPKRGVPIPVAFRRVQEALGLPEPGPLIAWEVWRTGSKSYVMVTDGRLRINVSLSVKFQSRAEARRWARSFLAGVGLEGLPERPHRPRKKPNPSA